MKGKLVRAEGHLANIIPIHLDASFFLKELSARWTVIMSTRH